MANVLVTEKRGLALSTDTVVLHQFLDASQAFDKTIHEIMARIAYQNGIVDDKWLYFVEMHKNSKKIVKWKGASSELFDENLGTRQGSHAASSEYKSYNAPMLDTLESLCGTDTIAGHPASVVAVADNTAPSTRDPVPQRALSNM